MESVPNFMISPNSVNSLVLLLYISSQYALPHTVRILPVPTFLYIKMIFKEYEQATRIIRSMSLLQLKTSLYQLQIQQVIRGCVCRQGIYCTVLKSTIFKIQSFSIENCAIIKKKVLLRP